MFILYRAINNYYNILEYVHRLLCKTITNFHTSQQIVCECDTWNGDFQNSLTFQNHTILTKKGKIIAQSQNIVFDIWKCSLLLAALQLCDLNYKDYLLSSYKKSMFHFRFSSFLLIS